MALPMKKAAMKKAAMKKATMKAAMKKGAMKRRAMKKAKKVSIIAKGRLAKVAVFTGRKEKTVGGMTKDKLIKNKAGRVVSKARSANAKKAFASRLKAWNDAVKAARKEL